MKYLEEDLEKLGASDFHECSVHGATSNSDGRVRHQPFVSEGNPLVKVTIIVVMP